MTLAKNKEKDHIFHMPSLSGLSFNWALLIIGVILAFYGLRAALGYRNVARDAQDDYDYILILTPVAMIAIQFLLEQLYQITGRSRVFEPGYLVAIVLSPIKLLLLRH